MFKKFNYTDSFNKTFNSTKEKTIIKCKKCGNTHYLTTDNILKAGYEKIKGTEDEYLCPICIENKFISEKEARKIDKEYKKQFGNSEASLFDEPFILSRDSFTWKEIQKMNKNYNKALRKFLKEKDYNFYLKYKDKIKK